jgi:DNA replication protein DnaC
MITNKESNMNNSATLEKMHALRLYGMERAFRSALETNQDRAFAPAELIAHTVEAEWDDRHNRKTNRLTHAAGFRARAALQDLDFSVDRGIDRALVLRLSDSAWITAGKTILVSGPTGVGKSFLVQSFGTQACILGFRTVYCSCSRLFQTLKDKRANGTYQRYVARIARTPLLILDDFGLAPLDTQDRLSLLEIVEDRLGRNATVIASQVPVAQWFDVIGDPTIADAICDRLVHQAIRINLTGRSMRAIQGLREQPEACAISAT